jgi:elongation factor G
MKALVWNDESKGSEYETTDIPADLQDAAAAGREKLIEAVASVDDGLMHKYIEGEEISEAEIRNALRQGTLELKLVPVVTGSAFKNKGVQTLLDAVVDYLPSPLDVPPVEGVNPKTGETETRPAEASAPFSGLVFKIMADKHLGQLSFVRIYSGTIKAGSYAYNPTKETKERVGRLMRMHANKREDIEEASAGEIIAIGGMKQVTTGDTVCDDNKPVILERMGVSRSGYPRRGRTQNPSGSGQARRRSKSARAGGSVVQCFHRSGNGTDDHRGHGRAAP